MVKAKLSDGTGPKATDQAHGDRHGDGNVPSIDVTKDVDRPTSSQAGTRPYTFTVAVRTVTD